MDVERTIQFILEQHAKTEAILADVAARQEAAERRQEEADRRMNRFERSLTRLANLGMRARNDLRRRGEELSRRAAEHEKWFEAQKVLLGEINERLNGLIGYVDHLPKYPPPAEPKG